MTLTSELRFMCQVHELIMLFISLFFNDLYRIYLLTEIENFMTAFNLSFA